MLLFKLFAELTNKLTVSIPPAGTWLDSDWWTMNVRRAGACPPTAPPHRLNRAVGSVEHTHTSPSPVATINVLWWNLFCFLPARLSASNADWNSSTVHPGKRSCPTQLKFSFVFHLFLKGFVLKSDFFYLRLCFPLSECCKVVSGSLCLDLYITTTRIPLCSCVHQQVFLTSLYQNEVVSDEERHEWRSNVIVFFFSFF